MPGLIEGLYRVVRLADTRSPRLWLGLGLRLLERVCAIAPFLLGFVWLQRQSCEQCQGQAPVDKHQYQHEQQRHGQRSQQLGHDMGEQGLDALDVLGQAFAQLADPFLAQHAQG